MAPRETPHAARSLHAAQRILVVAALGALSQFTFVGAGHAAESPPVYVRSFGSMGGAPGQFLYPSGIGTDASGNVYVADTFNNRIQKFTANGIFLLQWGSYGHGQGTFDLPWGVDCDSKGNVYVADSNNYLVQKFSPTGQFLTQWGTGFGDYAAQLCLDDSDNVYVAGGYGNQILKFRADGTAVTAWGSQGTGSAWTPNASGVAYSHGRIYVSDLYGGRIEVFDTSGSLLGEIGVPGQAYGELYYPEGLDTDAAGNLYVASSNAVTLTKFSPEGLLLTQWGAGGSGPGQFNDDTFDIAVHPNGQLYAVDRGNCRVQIYAPGAVPAQSITWGAIKDHYRR